MAAESTTAIANNNPVFLFECINRPQGMRGLYHPAVNQEVEGPTHCGIPISTHDKSTFNLFCHTRLHEAIKPIAVLV